MSTFLLTAGILMSGAGTVLAFRQPSAGAAAGYLGLWLLAGSGYAPIGSTALGFWALAVILVCVIGMERRGAWTYPPAFRSFVAAGALAGALVWLTVGSAVVAGAAIGALLGAVAYLRTPKGRQAHGPLLKALAETGLPAVVTMSMTGTALWSLLAGEMLFR